MMDWAGTTVGWIGHVVGVRCSAPFSKEVILSLSSHRPPAPAISHAYSSCPSACPMQSAATASMSSTPPSPGATSRLAPRSSLCGPTTPTSSPRGGRAAGRAGAVFKLSSCYHFGHGGGSLCGPMTPTSSPHGGRAAGRAAAGVFPMNFPFLSYYHLLCRFHGHFCGGGRGFVWGGGHSNALQCPCRTMGAHVLGMLSGVSFSLVVAVVRWVGAWVRVLNASAPCGAKTERGLAAGCLAQPRSCARG